MPEYPLWLNVRPIHQWPGQLTTRRVPSRFRANWGTTGDDLRRELRHLAPAGHTQAPIVLEVAVREEQIRRDRTALLSGQRPEHPGVILNVESRHGDLAYPCDTFSDWESNVRAVALTLRAIRQTEQYGVGKVEQFYRGFAQLTAATPGPPSFTVDEAIAYLGATAELDRSFDPSLTIASTAQLYRRAVAVAHPDKPSGNRQMWDRVEAAANTLRTAGRL